VSTYALRGIGGWASEEIDSADCYFKRALAFTLDDEVVKMLYGNYLAKRGEKEAAAAQYEEALQLKPDSIEVNYNAGLFYADIGNLAKARELANMAYRGGHPLPGLRRRIEEAEAAKSSQ
jgi:tetratricopeptide (TPR) repeat protein